MAGNTTWCSHVRKLLKSIRLSDIWEDQKILVSAESINQPKSLFKVELERCYTRNCLKDINNAEKHPILRTYTVFKEKRCLETYIQSMPIKKHEQAISRFWVSSHRQGIELGRHQKPYHPVEKQHCHFFQLEKSRRRVPFPHTLCISGSRQKKIFYCMSKYNQFRRVKWLR